MLTPEENDQLWYSTISRGDTDLHASLTTPRTSSDFFNRLKAEPLLDHTRLFRVARHRLESGKIANLLDDPHRSDFLEYLDSIDETSRIISDWIPFGYVLNNSPEALCMNTDGGSVIIVSEVVRYALFFMNIGLSDLFGFDDVPDDVQSAALMIAARTMTLDETLDFDMDPRGVIPQPILARAWGMVSWQMKFVIGHEFSHHRLGHLAEGSMPYRAARSPSFSSVERGWLAAKRSWEHEYEADRGALEAVTDDSNRLHVANGAIQFFLCLIFFEEVFEGLDADLKEVDTHPPTEERLRRIVLEFGSAVGIDEEWGVAAASHMRSISKQLIEMSIDAANIGTNELESRPLFGWYGSLYLGRWKGPTLIDRVDF